MLRMTSEDGRVTRLLDEAKVFMSITGPGKDVMKAVFQAFYSSTDMDSNNGQMTLKEFKQHRQIKTVELKSEFHGMDLRPLWDVDLLQTDQDITFYYSAIMNLNKQAFQNLEDKSRELLKKLKNERNKLSHNSDFLVQSLPDTLKGLEKLYIDILNVFDNEFPGSSYLRDAQVKIPSLNGRIRNETIDIDQYLEDRKQFNDDLQNFIVREGQGELAKYKRFGNSTDPFQKLLDLRCVSHHNSNPIEKVFTPPWIQQDQQKMRHQNLLEARDKQGELPRVVFLSGQGGSGKSTLIHKMFTEWQNRGSSLPSLKHLETFDFVLYVELKHTCSISLRELLERELLVESLQKANWHETFPILNDLAMLFLVDGFDEVKEDGKKLVCEIARFLPNSRILLTTRSEYLKEAQSLFQNSTSIDLDLRGFDKSDQESFARKVLELTEQDFSVAATMHVKFCEFLHRRGIVLKTHLELPLTMALLIFLWLEFRDSPEKLETINTATQLYQQLFLMLKEKLVRIRTLFAAVSEDAVENVLHNLRGAALEQLSLNILLQLNEKSYTSVREKCSENDLSDDDKQKEFLSAFLVYDPDALVKPKKTVGAFNPKPPYCFFHRTQMEYFGAEYAVTELASKKMSSLNDYLTCSEKRRYKEVFPFIAGCLSHANILDLHCKELISLSGNAGAHTTDFNFWFKLVSETARRDPFSGDTSLSEELCSKVTDKLPSSSWKLETETLISGLSLLIHCETVQIANLEIDCRINNDPNDITGLDVILKEASAVLGKRFRRNKIPLSLYIREHYMNYCKSQTDSYLKYFLTWSKLMNFTGHLEPQSVKHLSDCRLIDVKLSCLDGFNALMQMCKKKNSKRKRLTMNVSFVDSFDEEKVCPLPRGCSCEFRIHFHGVTSKTLDRVITFVDRCTSDGNSFDRLGVYASCLTYADGVRLFASMQNLVSHKLTVESTDRLTKEQEEGIMRDALAGSERLSTFQAEWNTNPV